MTYPRMISGLLLIMLSTVLQATEPALPPGVMVMDGRPAPALRLENIDGEAYELAAARGHWVFVHFWASWCGPCRREMPTIARMMSTLGDGPLEVVMVNTAETEDEVFTFLAVVAPDVVPLMDTDGLVTEHWQPRGLPATFLVDPAGTLRYLALGGRAWDTAPYLALLSRLASPEPEQNPVNGAPP
ncbi:MAG: TlpA family protein disulfide reductase [Gammaproteobacteria bacterium]|nr:TlpA family protein disulfide reductase [Gammaproteobacteria bacterium]